MEATYCSLLQMKRLLLLLSHFSRVQLCATPQTAAHQAPPSLGFSRQVGCRFLLQCMKVKSESEVAQSCLTPSDPMDCTLPGSSIHGIFQTRVLEWVAIAFSIQLIVVIFLVEELNAERKQSVNAIFLSVEFDLSEDRG